MDELKLIERLRRFVDETLWPELQELSATLRTSLSEVTDRIVAEVLHEDGSEAVVVEEGGQLPAPSPSPSPAPASPSTPASTPSAPSSRQDDERKREKRRERKRKKKRRRK